MERRSTLNTEFPAPYMSESTAFGFEAWLRRATEGLADVTKERLRREVYQAVVILMKEDGLSEREAVMRLGAPADANKRYLKRYLTEQDKEGLVSMFGPKYYRKHFQIYIYLVAAVAMIVASFFREEYRGGLMAAILLMLACYVWFSTVMRGIEKRLLSPEIEVARKTFRSILISSSIILFLVAVSSVIFSLGQVGFGYALAGLVISAGPHLYQAARNYQRLINNIDDCIAIVVRAWAAEDTAEPSPEQVNDLT